LASGQIVNGLFANQPGTRVPNACPKNLVLANDGDNASGFTCIRSLSDSVVHLLQGGHTGAGTVKQCRVLTNEFNNELSGFLPTSNPTSPVSYNKDLPRTVSNDGATVLVQWVASFSL
jgi:hypothetical protein